MIKSTGRWHPCLLLCPNKTKLGHLFARLVLILSQNNDVRKALLDSGKERTRAQLDQHIPRDAFWSSVVALSFNDSNVTVSLLFGDELKDVSSVYVPRVQRTGKELKRQYGLIRSHFITSYDC